MMAYHIRNGDKMREIYPGWDIVEWREEHIWGFEQAHIVKAMIDKRNYRGASDVFRLMILNEYGGFYVDSDAEPIADATDALRGRELMLVRETLGSTSNTYIGGIASLPLFQFMLRTLEHRLSNFKGGPELITGPWWLTNAFFDFLDSGITWPLSPRGPFYPYSFMQLLGRGGNQEMVQGKQEYPEGTLFAHHWASERQKPAKRKTNWALDMSRTQ